MQIALVLPTHVGHGLGRSVDRTDTLDAIPIYQMMDPQLALPMLEVLHAIDPDCWCG